MPSHHPDRFTVSFNGERLPVEFGANGRDWSWENAGPFPQVGSLPAFLQVKGCFHTLQRVACRGSCPQVFQDSC
ncbi:hypothetical protein GCM10010381_01910 [Streptomyces xantholiticus]|nr:hypothetical protein GCM10010381_01910 [Streptomyces xantholiticus]